MHLLRPLAYISVLLSAVLIGACSSQNDKNTEQSTDKTQQSSEAVMKELKTKPIQNFPSTPKDAADITLLDEYQEKFDAMNEALEADLEKMDAEGTLTEEIDQQRKRDSIQSALNMLKELDLKTEQGRYIQGLLYQYWENQAKAFDSKMQTKDQANNPAESVRGMSDLLSAEAQLDHWKTKTTP
ncbi:MULTISPECIES: hypothetical protein [unclassified Acinetobacter]|uniref:hypothetical protein n=1 Tax=unclassified Acinetobacter TaxID=196816 RepID=UPI002574A0F8|nr:MULTISPECIES: hypothetical protein [unclassified Acinetobacter]MDM1756769.1 hypothetical protein [Acinetobacter sp. 256-1]MDM1761921.1 hypothetical protein [Acinetobacter sp. 251-1]